MLFLKTSNFTLHVQNRTCDAKLRRYPKSFANIIASKYRLAGDRTFQLFCSDLMRDFLRQLMAGMVAQMTPRLL